MIIGNLTDMEFDKIRHNMYKTPPCNRQEYIIQRCKGKTVLDIGCTCWPNTELRIPHETFLHERLQKAASLVHGIDIDRKGVEYMRNVCGYQNVFCIDATDLREDISELEDFYDVVVLGDIVEHVTNPQEVLIAASSRVHENGELIVTLPNAFHLYSFLKALVGGSEPTHSDHVAYYSPMNIKELFHRCGLQLLELRGYYEDSYKEDFVKKALRRIERLGMSVFPATSCGIICRAAHSMSVKNNN